MILLRKTLRLHHEIYMKSKNISSTIALIFPEQLFANVGFTKDTHIILIEDSLIFGDKKYPLDIHLSKLVFHRATMKKYEEYLLSKKYTVTYIEWKDGRKFTELLPGEQLKKIVHYDFSDFVRWSRLNTFSKKYDITLEKLSTPYFLNSQEENKILLGDKKPRMQNFYIAQRRKCDILLEQDGQAPIGGKWSFDEENRKKIPKKEIGGIPSDITPLENKYIKEARAYVEKTFPQSIGSGNVYVPIEHSQAQKWLAKFLNERFALFGRYEDAMIEGQSQLYHSILSPLINVGLLTPQEVLDAVMERYIASRDKDAILASTEGFVRQIIGWREYMRAIYDLYGTTLRNANEWGHEGSLPKSFYTGETGILPLDDTLSRLLETGYSHHIERLMLLGNMMFLLRVHPHHVHKWFSEMYLDAYDWVMVGNVYGMSQCSKIDFITTKPYICGSNYIKKMSNYTCSKNETSPTWCDIWDALYWQFLIDNETTLRKNHRWKMMYAHVDRFNNEKKKHYKKVVADFRKK